MDFRGLFLICSPRLSPKPLLTRPILYAMFLPHQAFRPLYIVGKTPKLRTSKSNQKKKKKAGKEFPKKETQMALEHTERCSTPFLINANYSCTREKNCTIFHFLYCQKHTVRCWECWGSSSLLLCSWEWKDHHLWRQCDNIHQRQRHILWPRSSKNFPNCEQTCKCARSFIATAFVIVKGDWLKTF